MSRLQILTVYYRLSCSLFMEINTSLVKSIYYSPCLKYVYLFLSFLYHLCHLSFLFYFIFFYYTWLSLFFSLLFQFALKAEFENAIDMGSLMRANTAVSRMMTTYTRRGPGQEYLKASLSEQLRLLMQDKLLNLEIEPLKVRHLIQFYYFINPFFYFIFLHFQFFNFFFLIFLLFLSKTNFRFMSKF